MKYLLFCLGFSCLGLAKAADFSLILETSEPSIKSGQIETEIIKKRFDLPGEMVARSKEFQKISTQLEPELIRIFKSLDREPENAHFVLENEVWIARQRSSWKVDVETTKNNLLEAILENKNSAQIAINRTPPNRTVEKWFSLGIVDLFGSGTSSFRGSPSFRVTNILAGAKRLDNVYIAPGTTFDFNQTVGVISYQNGFVPGYVISGGILARELGGGICQVSTTIFRAAFLSGLPMVERHYHSYRVHYYEPVGLEATVYSPQKNFRFLNDTGAHLFIQASWDLKKQTLTFYLFGPKSDRTVKVSDAIITNRRAAPGPRFIADKNVRLGRARMIDGPEAGLNVLINRQVLIGSETRRDSVSSYYQPWGAIWAVNPNDPRLGKK